LTSKKKSDDGGEGKKENEANRPFMLDKMWGLSWAKMKL